MRSLLSLIFALLFINGIAQYEIPNSSFDNWSTNLMWSNPDSFETSNFQSYFDYGAATVVKSPAAHGGMFCAMLRTEQEYNAAISIGTPGNEGFLNAMTFVGAPDSLVLWANYDIADGDNATIVAMLQLNGVVLASVWITPSGTSNGYERFSFPFTYAGIEVPNELGFMAVNTSFDNPQQSSVLFIDDIEFIYSVQAGQSFPNGDFENWTDQSTTEPDSWTSSNINTLPYPSASSSTDAVSGLSARIESQPIMFSKGGSFGYVLLGDLNSDVCGAGAIELDGISIPMGVSGMYKYIPAAETNDSASVFFSYDYYDEALENCENRLEWVTTLPAAIEWTAFNVNLPFEMYSQWCFSPLFPDYFSLGFASTIVALQGELQGQVGSVLYIDDLSLTIDFCWPVIEHEKISFELFPNPATDRLRISNMPNGNNEITIINALGKVISSQKCNASTKELDITDLPEGQYFVRIVNGEQSLGKAFIKTN